MIEHDPPQGSANQLAQQQDLIVVQVLLGTPEPGVWLDFWFFLSLSTDCRDGRGHASCTRLIRGERFLLAMSAPLTPTAQLQLAARSFMVRNRITKDELSRRKNRFFAISEIVTNEAHYAKKLRLILDFIINPLRGLREVDEAACLCSLTLSNTTTLHLLANRGKLLQATRTYLYVTPPFV